MNYIELINRFWAFNEEVSFSVTDVALYFYLVKVNNACSWKEMFRRNNHKIMADLSIRSLKTLAESRNRLKQAGLIDFQTKNGSAETTYSLTSVKNTEVDAEVSSEVRYEVTSRLGRGCDRVKINRNKNTSPPLSPDTGEDENENKAKEDHLVPDLSPAAPGSPPGSAPPPQSKTRKTQQPPDLSFIEDEDMRQVFLEWLEYKTASGKSYKTEQSLRMCYRKLDRLSGGNPVVGREMIEESMANNWQSFFEIKKPTNYERSAKNQPPSPHELARAVAEGVARANTRQEWE